MADEEPPKNVKELLVEAKDVSELMVDLAYAAVFFNEEDLAEEVEELEARMDGYLRRLREVAMLAARSPEDAEAMAGVLHIAGAPPLPPGPESEGPPLTELDRAVDILVEMKNSAEAAVGLAYSSLLFNDAALAAEVTTLETRSDTLEDELESWVLRAAPEARHPDELRGILRIGYASESIFDAARDMTWLVEQGEELHPVVAMALEESEEVATETVVERGSRADGHSLKELQVQTETGMHVLAVQRGRRWIYRPRPRFELEAGDRVISIGPEAGAEELEALCTVPAWAVPAE